MAGLATALKHRGLISLDGQQPDRSAARSAFAESLRLRRAGGDQDGRGSRLNDRPALAMYERDFGRASQLLDESLACCRDSGNLFGLSFVLSNLGLVSLELGDHGRAEALLREGLALARRLGSRDSVGCML